MTRPRPIPYGRTPRFVSQRPKGIQGGFEGRSKDEEGTRDRRRRARGGRSGHGDAHPDRVGGKQAKQTINIAVFLASAANTYWEAELLGAKDVAAKNPNVKLTVFDAKFTTNTQVSQLRDALVSKKYQAWFVGPNDGGPLTPTIKQAIAQGVKVGCSLVPCGPNIRDVNVQIPGQVIFAGLGFYPERAAARPGRRAGLPGDQPVQGAVAAGPADAAARGGSPGGPLLHHQAALEHQGDRDRGRRLSRRAGSHRHARTFCTRTRT